MVVKNHVIWDQVNVIHLPWEQLTIKSFILCIIMIQKIRFGSILIQDAITQCIQSVQKVVGEEVYGGALPLGFAMPDKKQALVPSVDRLLTTK